VLIIAIFSVLYIRDSFAILGLPIVLGLWYIYIFRNKIADYETFLLLALGVVSLIFVQAALSMHIIADYYDNIFNHTHWDISVFLYQMDEYYTHYILYFPSVTFLFIGLLALMRNKFPRKESTLLVYNILFGILLELMSLLMVEGHLTKVAIITMSIALLVIYDRRKNNLTQAGKYVLNLLALSLGMLIGIELVKLLIAVK